MQKYRRFRLSTHVELRSPIYSRGLIYIYITIGPFLIFFKPVWTHTKKKLPGRFLLYIYMKLPGKRTGGSFVERAQEEASWKEHRRKLLGSCLELVIN